MISHWEVLTALSIAKIFFAILSVLMVLSLH
jgi:hypothetical protein